MLNFLPRDEKYFERFTELAVRIHEAAQDPGAVLPRASRRGRDGGRPDQAPRARVRRDLPRDPARHRPDVHHADRPRGHPPARRPPRRRHRPDRRHRAPRRRSSRSSSPTPLSPGARRSLIVTTTGELVEAVSRLRQQKGVMAHCIRDQAARERGRRRLPRGDRFPLPRRTSRPSRSSSGRTSTTTWSAASTRAWPSRTCSRASSSSTPESLRPDDSSMTYVLLIIAIALVFDFINGMHDSANSIATVVSTRVLSPFVAVFWAAFFNFVAAFVFGTAVAKTIGTGPDRHHRRQLGRRARRTAGRDRLEPDHLVLRDPVLVLARPDRRLRRRGGRAGGRPGDRSGHGLGQDALLHRALAADRHGGRLGPDGRRSPGSSTRRRTARCDRWFRRAQLGSAAAFSLSHGTNDAQKTMGIIGGLLVANRELFADPASAFTGCTCRI